MTPTLLLTLLLQGLVPLLWSGWIALGPRQRPLAWATHVAALAAFLGLGGVAGLWLALPRAFLGVAWVLFVLAAIVGWIRGRGAPKRGLPARIGIAGRILLLLGLLAGIGTALRGRTPPEGIQPVELAFPLDEGRYLVANGGATTIVNAHLGTLDPDPRYDPWRGQSHAVDLVAEGRWGSRLRGLAPSRPSDYAIWNARVLAPCSGTVVQAVDGLPDLPVPERDTERMAGNHLILACGEFWVVLGHLRSGSVRVAAGDEVRQGQGVGRVGNSGNTEEPHLHIHAQTPGTVAAPLSGRPVPILLDGRWWVRNDRIRVRMGDAES